MLTNIGFSWNLCLMYEFMLVLECYLYRVSYEWILVCLLPQRLQSSTMHIIFQISKLHVNLNINSCLTSWNRTFGFCECLQLDKKNLLLPWRQVSALCKFYTNKQMNKNRWWSFLSTNAVFIHGIWIINLFERGNRQEIFNPSFNPFWQGSHLWPWYAQLGVSATCKQGNLQKSVVNTKFQNLSKTRTMNGQENKSEHYNVTRTKQTSFTSKRGIRIKSCKHTSTLAKFQTHFRMWKSLFIYKIHSLFGPRPPILPNPVIISSQEPMNCKMLRCVSRNCNKYKPNCYH